MDRFGAFLKRMLQKSKAVQFTKIFGIAGKEAIP
jgi:hypothetical protein